MREGSSLRLKKVISIRYLEKLIPPPKETLNRMSAALKGKNNPLFGITPSEETKTKISVALGTAIEVFDMKTEVTSVYTSIRQAAESIGCVHGTILLALKSSRAIKKDI